MIDINAELKHDFINNSLRLEVLMKMICKNLETKSRPETKHIDDLERFLSEQQKLLNQIKQKL